MKKALTIGGAVYDIFIQYEHPETLSMHTHETDKRFLVLEEGTKVEVKDLAYRSGGGATNSAASFKHLGFQTSTFFKVGTDAQAQEIINELNALHIDTAWVKHDAMHATGTSFIFPTQHDRIVLVYRGASMHLEKSELPLQAIEQTDLLYVTSLCNQAAALLPEITSHAQRHKKLVAVNPGTSQLRDHPESISTSLKNIEILIMNSHEAKILCHSIFRQCSWLTTEIAGSVDGSTHDHQPELLQAQMTYQNICFNLKDFCQEILNHGPRIVAITNGAEGVYVATKENLYFHPSMPSNIISTLGAGDAFGSAFVAQIAHGASIPDALRAGIINACAVIEHVGAKEGLLSRETLETRLKQVDEKLLQTFSW